ncbi:hypothetical protein ES703_96786 [subsurface metagenome]
MARVRLIEKEQAPPEVREIFQKIEDNGAKILNLYKVAAHSPKVLLNFIRLGNSIIGRMELSPRLREIVILRVATLTGSEYEWAQHAPVARQVGVSQKQLDAIPDWKNSAEFNNEERAILQYTDEVAQQVKVTDQTFNTLKNFFSEQLIVELTMTIGYYEMVARLLVPLQVEVDESSVGSASDLIGRRARSK